MFITTTYIIPFITGMILAWTLTARTLSVWKGEVLKTVLLSSLLSIAYWWNIHYVAANKLNQYIALSIGMTVSTSLMAHKAKRKKDEDSHSKGN